MDELSGGQTPVAGQALGDGKEAVGDPQPDTEFHSESRSVQTVFNVSKCENEEHTD